MEFRVYDKRTLKMDALLGAKKMNLYKALKEHEGNRKWNLVANETFRALFFHDKTLSYDRNKFTIVQVARVLPVLILIEDTSYLSCGPVLWVFFDCPALLC